MRYLVLDSEWNRSHCPEMIGHLMAYMVGGIEAEPVQLELLPNVRIDWLGFPCDDEEGNCEED